MKRLILFAGSLAGGAALFAFLIRGVGWEEIWEPLSAFSLAHVLVIGLLTAAFLFVGAFRWRFILQRQGCSISLFSACRAYLAGFSLLFFFPVFPFASEFFRASKIRERHSIEAGKSAASVVIDRILEITANLVIVMVGGVVFIAMGSKNDFSGKLMFVGAFIALWLGMLSFLYVRLFQRKSVVRLFWKGNGTMRDTEQEVLRFFQPRNAWLWQAMALSLVKSLLGVVRVWAVLLFFGKGLALLPGITIHGFYYLAILVPIPAALGSQEALQAVAFGNFGFGAATGAAFALVVRSAEALFALGGLLVLLHAGIQFLRKTLSATS